MAVQKFERRVCDRCGHTAETPDDDSSYLWERMAFPTSGGGDHSCAEIPHCADLCPDCRNQLINWWRRKPPTPVRITDVACTISDEDLASLLCWKLDADIHDRREFAEAFVGIGTQDSDSLLGSAKKVQPYRSRAMKCFQ